MSRDALDAPPADASPAVDAADAAAAADPRGGRPDLRGRWHALARPGSRGAGRWFSGRSLRARLVALVTGLLVVALVLTGLVTAVLLRSVLTTQVDEDLEQAIRNPGRLISEATDSDGNGGGRPSDYLVQVSYADGTVLPTPQAPNQDVTLDIEGLSSAVAAGWGDTARTLQVAQGEDGESAGAERYRVVVTQVQDTAGTTYVVAVARSLDPVDQTVSRVVGWFVLLGLVVVLACALLGYAGVARAFRPLREVEAVATAFGGGDTSRRVDAAPPSTEVGRLGHAVNGMLDSIETSMAAREASEERMRRFVADASHELRTPLAAVRGFAELHRMGAIREPADVATAFGRVEHEAIRMGGLVEDLLVLARLDEQRPLERRPVDLLLLAADARHDAGALAPERTVTLVGASDGEPPAPVVVTGDDAKLRQVVANLLANALRHTPAGTPVEIGVGVRDGSAVLRIVDHGPGIPPEDAERVFERFYRADPSRARHQGGGSGLGLAIVAAIVTGHRGAVRMTSTPGGGATAEVALPFE